MFSSTMRAACLTRRAFLHGSARAVILSGLGANLLSACGGGTGNDGVNDTPRLASVENFRDVSGTGAGYPTADGGRLRRGVFYRSGVLALDAAGTAAFAGLGIRMVYDLRTVGEAVIVPDRLPQDVLREAIDIAPIDTSGVMPASAWMASAQRRLVSDPAVRAQFGVLLTRVARTPAPQLFHGATGKDRTGWAAALLLAIAGVPLDVIIEDYLLTNTCAAAAIEARIDRTGQPGAARLFRAEAGTLQAAFDEIQQTFGTLADYLGKGLGVMQDDVGMLRAKLVA